MKVLFNEQVKTGEETYQVKIIENPIQLGDGRVSGVSETARRFVLDRHEKVEDGSVVLEIERKSFLRYLGILVDCDGFFVDGSLADKDCFYQDCTIEDARTRFPLEKILDGIPASLYGRFFGLTLPQPERRKLGEFEQEMLDKYADMI